MTLEESFPVRLKELREAAGYTQQSFADAFGVAQSTVGNWEAGRRELKRGTLMKLAAFFDVSLDCLVGSLGKDTALDRLRIKEARQRAGLLQKDMAEQLGIASNTFHGYESGKHTPTPQMLRRIADICGVTVDYLLGGSEEEPSTERSNDVLAIAVETWGKDAQIDIAVEELSELIKALLKERRAVKTGCDAHIEAARKNVAKEMADVYIMLSQLGLIFHNRGEVQKQIDYKANRLFDRICEENEKV